MNPGHQKTHTDPTGNILSSNPEEIERFQDSNLADGGPRITLRAILLGVLTIAFTFYYIVEVGQRLRVGSYVHSQFPMAAFVPFVLWLFCNIGLKALWPRMALRRGEMLTLFIMLWVVGTLPQLGWMNYWTSITAAPSYFATTENQWEETFFEYLPWHVFADTSTRVIDPFWFGLPEGGAIPWDGWIAAIGQWLGVSLGMVVFGLCLIVLFQKQWVENEKLTFPLAQMPLDLTRGIDAARRVPDIFRTSAFWVGFAVVFLAILYNIGTYFATGLPPLELFWESYDLRFSEDIVFSIRVLPLVLALTYLCPVDILGSLIVFHWLAVLKRALMTRMGFALDGFGAGAGAGSAEPLKIIFMESYGALIFIGVWSVWLARRHLRQVWQQVHSGRGDCGEVRRYRVAVAGLVLSGAWVVGWGVGLGMSLPLAVASFTLMVMSYFVTAKLVAATGFAYLLPNKTQVKGNSFIIDLIGSVHLSPRSLVAYKVFTSNAFFGTFRIPAWPALPHCLRLFSLSQPGSLTTAILAAFLVGFLVAALATIVLAYDGGGHLFLGGKANWVFDDTVHLMNNPVQPALSKWGVWLFGFTEAAIIAVLRGYFHWFPLHPIGLAFQNTFGVRLYWFSLFIVWVVKLTLLRYGGVKAFRKGKPFFYGLAIGYVVGVILSNMVDLIWFPAKGHHVHGW